MSWRCSRPWSRSCSPRRRHRRHRSSRSPTSATTPPIWACTCTCRTTCSAHPAILVAVHQCTGSGSGVLLRHPVRVAGRPVRVHRHLPVGHPQRQLLRRVLATGVDPQRKQRPGRHRLDGRLRRAALQRRHQPRLRHRRVVRRHDDRRPARRLPGRVQGRRRVHGRPVRLLRHHRRLDVERAVRQRPDHHDPAAVGRLWCATPIPATPAPGRACSCGTAPPTAR